MRRKIILAMFALMLFVVGFVGCDVLQTDDGQTRYRLNPKTGQQFEDKAGTGLELLTILAPFLGPAGGIAVGGLATGLTIIKKLRPKLEKAQTKAEMSNTIASCLVHALEEVKTKHPEAWKKSREQIVHQLKDSGIDTKILENVIRGLRGLPAKT